MSRLCLWMTSVALSLSMLASCSAAPSAPSSGPLPSAPTPSSPPKTQLGSASSTPSSLAPPASEPPLDWDELCILANLPAAELRTQRLGDGVVWAEESLTLFRQQAALMAREGGREHRIFTDTSTPPDVYIGEVHVSGRWVLFMTADSIDWAAPWRLRIWDRTRPESPPGVVSSYDGKATNPGFPLPQLRGDRLIWARALDTGQRRIELAELDRGVVTTLAEGLVYQPQWVDDHTVVWQQQEPDGQILLQASDVDTGERVVLDNPIAAMDAQGAGYATDGEFWVLTNVPSGERDDANTTYDTWAWHPSWPAPKRVLALAGPAYFSTTAPLSDGLLGATLQLQGAYAIDLRAGTARRLREDWAVVSPSRDSVVLEWGEGGESQSVRATVPVGRVRPLAESCTGQPLRG